MAHVTIGVPTEIKPDENRVAITAAGVRACRDAGHVVVVQSGAGSGSWITDEEFADAGAEIVADAAEVWARGDLVVKVKEPQPEETARMRAGQILFAYLHLAPDAEQTRGLLDSGAVAVAFETVVDAHGHLPLLAPMSQIAGRMSAQVGASLLERPNGGRGILMGGVPGVPGADVLVLGGGVVGTNAARIAAGMGADVTVVDNNLSRLAELDEHFGNSVETRPSNVLTIEGLLRTADLVIGSVLVPGARTPHLVTREMLGLLRERTVVVDVAVDQGGCLETSRPTTHADPTFEVDGIIHYCVGNMPGAVATTATHALANATLPYLLRIADGGTAALRDEPDLTAGVNVARGAVTHAAVAAAHALDHTPVSRALSS